MGLDRTAAKHIITAAKGAPAQLPTDVARVQREADPFVIDGACEFNGGGAHQIIAGCRDIVCAHCARVFWRWSSNTCRTQSAIRGNSK